MAVRSPAGPWLAALLTLLLAASLSACDDSQADDPDAATSGGSTASSASAATSPAPVPSSPGTPRPSSGGPRFHRYVALGDSYTAAPGVGTMSDDGCFRSDRNYPHLLAAALSVGELVDVSCSGADTTDVRGRQLGRYAPQLDAVDRSTDLVTIGLGGNDEDLFRRLLGGCERGQRSPLAACFDASGAGPIIDRTEHRLVGVVRSVRAKAPAARVLLVGYPQVLPAGKGCATTPYFAGNRFARRVNRELTEAVRRAAHASGATYVDLWTVSAGHDLCSADPWINGSSGPGAAPFHPFEVEQAAVARQVVAALG